MFSAINAPLDSMSTKLQCHQLLVACDTTMPALQTAWPQTTSSALVTAFDFVILSDQQISATFQFGTDTASAAAEACSAPTLNM